MTNYSHLSYEDRKNIEDGLNQNKSINQIAKELNRSHFTILREVDRNRKYSEPTSWNNYKINHPDLDLSCEWICVNFLDTFFRTILFDRI